MRKLMKLKGVLQKRSDGLLQFAGKLHDGSRFEVMPRPLEVEESEPFADGSDVTPAWLHVVQEAQQDTRCYLTLPQPSLPHGRQVVVHERELMPRVATLAMFGAKLVEGGKKAVAEAAPKKKTLKAQSVKRRTGK